MRVTTLAKFRELTKDLPEDTPIIVPRPDHSFDDATISAASTALKEKYGWTEDFGEEYTPEAEYGKRTSVIIIT